MIFSLSYCSIRSSSIWEISSQVYPKMYISLICVSYSHGPRYSSIFERSQLSQRLTNWILFLFLLSDWLRGKSPLLYFLSLLLRLANNLAMGRRKNSSNSSNQLILFSFSLYFKIWSSLLPTQNEAGPRGLQNCCQSCFIDEFARSDNCLRIHLTATLIFGQLYFIKKKKQIIPSANQI